LMAKDTKQIKIAFSVAAIIALVIYSLTCFIGLIVFSSNPNIEESDLLVYVVQNYSMTGFKVLLIIGIMAMIMSTADSYINVGAVIFVNDICRPLNCIFIKEILLAKSFSVLIGVVA